MTVVPWDQSGGSGINQLGIDIIEDQAAHRDVRMSFGVPGQRLGEHLLTLALYRRPVLVPQPNRGQRVQRQVGPGMHREHLVAVPVGEVEGEPDRPCARARLVHADHHLDRTAVQFFQRILFDATALTVSREVLEARIAALAADLTLRWRSRSWLRCSEALHRWRRSSRLPPRRSSRWPLR